jgi:DNA-binding NarL/FixJ family response regulator
MLVVVADDQPQMLSFVKRWFSRRYADDDTIRLETHDDLTDLEDFVKGKLLDDDHLLLFLDLNWEDNKERSLKWVGRIKRSRKTRHWPVLIYSESNSESDVLEAYVHYANGYVHKGNDEQEEHFVEVLEHWRLQQLLPPS